MDRRWPWKKKSSDKVEKAEKAATAAALESAASLGTAGSNVNQQDSYKKPKYVQISVESYSHLTGLEEQVKSYEEQIQTYDEQVQTLENDISELNDKLAAAESEMVTKENLVKQHAKVAEEAVSGWEKAEAEALTLKTHLESVTLLKLTAEDRASHLDGALKECMRQIRNLKEDHEQELHDVIFANNQQWEKIKLDLETKIANLDQELRRSAADNAAISRSLQDRSNMLMKISEEKSHAEAEIERLKSNIESCEREINSLKYELHISSKELEIRNEEKNMSVRSAEVANRQHLEGVKKIAKLEAECQRLRGLVRKKLPGPAAVAQMKLEVESLGRDYGDSRLRRSSSKPSSPHSPLPEFSLDNLQNFQKEKGFLTERLLAMEEETKMLKEALAKRNSELQASRNMSAKIASKLQSLESQLNSDNQQKNLLKLINTNSPPSLTSMSEDGNDDSVSCSGSWSAGMISELSHIKKEKSEKSKSENAVHLEIMDDFLEMEKLARLSNDSASVSDNGQSKGSEDIKQDAPTEVPREGLSTELPSQPDNLAHKVSSDEETSVNLESDVDKLPLVELKSRLSLVLESIREETDTAKILKDIKDILQDAQVSCLLEETHCSYATCDRQICPDDAGMTVEKEISSFQSSQPVTQTVDAVSEELADAISQIHDFVLYLVKEARTVQESTPDSNELREKVEGFSARFNRPLYDNFRMVDFVMDLSRVLSSVSELSFGVRGYKTFIAESHSSDCIDKVALPENNEIQNNLVGERYSNGHSHASASDSEFLPNGNSADGFESHIPCKYSLEEYEQLKLEKDNLAMDLAKCTETLESRKSQLLETEQLLTEVKSQLASSQKSNSLAETQLKCMAESYRSLERRSEELEAEINHLRVITESLEKDLQEEKRNHQDAITRYNDLQAQLQSFAASGADNENKAKEKELAAAAEKLAECQESIFLLGRQLKSLCPQTELAGSPQRDEIFKGEALPEDEPPRTSGANIQAFNQAELESAGFPNFRRVGSESPITDVYYSSFNPSDTEGNFMRSPISSKHGGHRPTKSGSSSSSSNPTPEKPGRGISRFFSSKGKNGI